MKNANATNFTKPDDIPHIERDEIIRFALKRNGDDQVVVRVRRNIRNGPRLNKGSPRPERVDHGSGLVGADEAAELEPAADSAKLTKLSLRSEQFIAPFAPAPVKLRRARVRCDEGGDKYIGVEDDLQDI